MRIRPNIFLVSSLLLTLGVLWLLPSTIECIRTTNTMYRLAGLASLTIIIVALIIIWTGLAAGNRVAWVIMAVIVCVWALPFMTWPVLRHGQRWTLSELHGWVVGVVDTWREDSSARTVLNQHRYVLVDVGRIDSAGQGSLSD